MNFENCPQNQNINKMYRQTTLKLPISVILTNKEDGRGIQVWVHRKLFTGRLVRGKGEENEDGILKSDH